MSLIAATVRQIIEAEPWRFAASDPKKQPSNSGSYYSNEETAIRKKRQDDALAAMRQFGPMNSDEVAAQIGCTRLEAAAVFSVLVTKDMAERIEDGRYRLLEAK